MDVSGPVEKLLEPVQRSTTGWRFWERRTINFHRVVGEWTPGVPLADADELERRVRGTIAENFRSSWWRGLGFGVVIRLPELTVFPADLTARIDAVNRRKGCWQWVIVIAAREKLAYGIHTWIEGYLSPVYREILRLAVSESLEIASVKRDRGGLMDVLVEAAEAYHFVHTLGLGSSPFQEFRDE